MKKCLLLACAVIGLGFMAGSPLHAQTFVQGVLCTGTGTVACSAFGATTAHNTIIVFTRCNTAGCTPTITDSAGNSFTNKANCANIQGSSVAVYEADNIIGGADTVTVAAGGGVFNEGHALEYSGMSYGISFDQSVCASGTGVTTLAVGPTGATTRAKEIALVFYSASAGAPSTPVGYTSRFTGSSNDFNKTSDQTVTAAQTFSAMATFTSSTVWAMIATFKNGTGGTVIR